MIKIAIFVTHPVQYHVPIWRALAATPGVEPMVFYFSDHSVCGGVDAGFGRAVAWDVPLLEGYRHVFVERHADLTRPKSVVLRDAEELLRDGGFTHVLVSGYVHGFEQQVVSAAHRLGLHTLMRGECSDAGRRRGMVKRLARDTFLRWFYGRVRSLCYVGMEARDHLLRFVEESRLFASPYAVDTGLFDEQKQRFDREGSRRSFGFRDDDFVVLFSGKLISRKDPLLLVDAVAALAPELRAHLLIVGDGPLRSAVQDRARTKLGDRFHDQGFVNQSVLGASFRAADAFALPSRYEAWGLVANEAMQFGLPVVLSDGVNAHRDLIGAHETGLVFRAGDRASLTARLAELAGDPARARSMGANAEQRIGGFSTEAAVGGILAACNSTAGSVLGV